jgi:hypothetical protein
VVVYWTMLNNSYKAQSMFADGMVFTNTSKPHAPGTKFVSFRPEYDALIRRLHDHFVITTRLTSWPTTMFWSASHTTYNRCGLI